MKIFLLAFSALLLTASFGGAQTKYSTYSNGRFGYAIEYPAGMLVVQPAPANDDGRTFRSRDGKVEMRVWGAYVTPDMSMQQEYENAFAELDEKPSYARVDEGEFVFSGLKKGKIFYQRTVAVMTPEGEVRTSFTIEYPRSQKARWDKIVTRISRSFKAMVLGVGN